MINERVWPLYNGITGHWRQTKFNESALLGESGVKLREVKINLAHFPVSPDFWLSYRLWKELDRQGIRFSLLSESKIRSVGDPVTLHFTDLTEDWDVVHVVVVRQGRHESVAETRLAAPHAPLVLLAPGEPHHGHRDQLAGTSDGCRVPASESEASWNGNKVRSLWPTQLKSWPQLEDDTRQILRTEISGGDAILCQEGGIISYSFDINAAKRRNRSIRPFVEQSKHPHNIPSSEPSCKVPLFLLGLGEKPSKNIFRLRWFCHIIHTSQHVC